MLIIFIVVLLVLSRLYEFWRRRRYRHPHSWGYAEFRGEQQYQSDYGEVVNTQVGTLAVLADGIGKLKRGRVSSHVAVDSVTSLFKLYQVMPNPVYFFQRCFNYANAQILKALDDREGGVSLGCVLIAEDKLYYVLAGNIKISLCRNGNLIPLSEGHTINRLAERAYKEGKLTRQKALYVMKEERMYNYVGQDGFREIEFFDKPVHVKAQDRILLMTKGVYEALPWQNIENILSNNETAYDQAQELMARFAALRNMQRDNGSAIVVEVR